LRDSQHIPCLIPFLTSLPDFNPLCYIYKYMFEFILGGTVTTPQGFEAGAVCTGIKNHCKFDLDLGILLSARPCAAAAVFTTNKIQSAGVRLCREMLPSDNIRGVVINSGCANTSTGEQGMEDARAMMSSAACHASVSPGEMLVASTGVIGRRLPIDVIQAKIPAIKLSPEGGHDLAMAIPTTDSVTKEVALKTSLGFTIGGIAKGSGMIHPNMGTMLCFLTTDAGLSPEMIQAAVKKSADISFNMVSIDGDTSPNDTMLLMANGASGVKIAPGSKEADVFQQALDTACIKLARMMARDGEGASRLIEITVKGAASQTDARIAARTITTSPLVKAAIHGGDPNWGRIIVAAGRSGAELVESKLDMDICGIGILRGGVQLPLDIEKLVKALSGEEITILLDLNLGEGQATAWGCDLSPDYATINSDYCT
jgi:glutamate N-acetyltransferase/amino-acid N-acetyltransferase